MIELGTDVVGLPGYNETMRLVQGTHPSHGLFKPAWSKLDLFPLSGALDFLTPKLWAAARYPDPEHRVEAMTEIALGFAVLCVCAERENQALTDS